MYSVRFYKDKDGNEPVKEYLKELGTKTDKNSRINFNKIRDYIKTLSEYGTRAGEPYIKHIGGDIWELRPSATAYCSSDMTVSNLYCYLILSKKHKRHLREK